MNLTAVYINTHRYDYKLTCICVASVRYWYPDIEIYLIKDYRRGDFNTSLLQRCNSNGMEKYAPLQKGDLAGAMENWKHCFLEAHNHFWFWIRLLF